MLPTNSLNAPITTPVALGDDVLRVIPLGGLGEVGRNCSIVEMIDPIPKGKSRLIMLDCGVLFPGEDEPGVDLILPDFSYIMDKLERLDAVCLTHGHEDHIGAVPFLLKLRHDIPVVGTKYTLELLRKKLEEHEIIDYNFVEVREGDHVRFGAFALEFFAVSHSIPDAVGVVVKTSAGNIIDTGDFKMDQAPLDGRVTDLGKIAELSKVGIDLLMTDSTNAMRGGFIGSDQALIPEIDKIFAHERDGAIIATTFASNIHRIQMIMNAALNNNRKVVFLGRSMLRNTDVALEHGYLNVPYELANDLVVDIRDAASLPRNRVCIICTGSQGETLAALGRMSINEHPFYNIEPKDAILFASSLVPGNEKAVTGLINRLVIQGATIYDSSTNNVHTSGHAAAGELSYLYNVVRPYNVLPVHGEPRMLVSNAKIATTTLNNKQIANHPSWQFTKDNAFIMLNGCVLDIKDHTASITGRIESGYIYVDGGVMGSVTADDLKHRRILSEEGFLVIQAIIDIDQRRVISQPRINAVGMSQDIEAFYPLAQKCIKRLNRALNEDNVRNISKLNYITMRTAKEWLKKNFSSYAMVMPMIVEAQETMV